LLETPMMIADGLVAPSGGPRLSYTKRELYRALTKGKLLLGSMGSSGLKLHDAPEHISKLIRMAMRCDDNFDNSQGDLADTIKCLQTRGQAAKALDLALKSSDLHSSIYGGVAMLDLNMGIKQVSVQVDKYLQQLLASTDDKDYMDPMLYYVYYLTWRKCGSNRKSERVRAAFALTALRCFPAFAENWVDADDDIDVKVKAEGLMEEEASDMDDDDDELEEDPAARDSPEAEWQLAKSDHQLKSEGLDQLMALTGLRDIKKKAMGVVKEVLLQKGRPASVKAEISMNFLFTGNPGCGKTTVAKLLARAMNQLGFRKNATMIETSAQDILKCQNPGSDFADMMKQATGGCLFIDEAYRFSPAPAGQQPNASNEVLDYLLEAVEKPEIRSTTTVILAGYRDEIETLLAYNVGFASRFNREFSFPDYTEAQLCKIFVGMVKDRGFLLESKKDCGVSISAVMANRIHRGAGKKGFGNAREVRNKVEEVIAQQSDRLGTMRLHKKPVSERDYKLLLAVDSVGVRPDFSRSPIMRELEAMVGLKKVKEQFRSLMMMATQNFDREMRGEKPNLISLHRVFYGNPGTGKTTVSKLYGALLKELGYLSKGDFISVTPADLTGDAEGGAATNTKAVLDKAKGKVLLIDEAYILDPKRKNNIYGGNVLDTMVEKLDGDAGSDCAVILAGYRQEMFDMLENNPGLRRRFNIDDFGIEFEALFLSLTPSLSRALSLSHTHTQTHTH
jgi:SpoVK/Ycf46/Vps4 family AAA+-type ATPase